MDADQIHELMQDAAARPLRYLTGVFTEWQATNKPGYRVKVEAVLKEIEQAERIFGVTLENGATQGETTTRPRSTTHNSG